MKSLFLFVILTVAGLNFQIQKESKSKDDYRTELLTKSPWQAGYYKSFVNGQLVENISGKGDTLIFHRNRTFVIKGQEGGSGQWMFVGKDSLKLKANGIKKAVVLHLDTLTEKELITSKEVEENTNRLRIEIRFYRD